MEIAVVGTLYVVATPIGNLEDITLRAIDTLSRVDIILCEDTRRSLKLLNHLGIKKKLYSHNSYNERRTVEKVLRMLDDGLEIALISDSGTPCISDPGSFLINKAATKGHKIISIPGASASTSLLSISGFPLHNFLFIGFLSPKKSRREKKLLSLKGFEGNIIIYESPHRIEKLIADIAHIFEEEEVIIGRELTKKFEEIIRSKANNLKEIHFTKKGEYTIIINNTTKGYKKDNLLKIFTKTPTELGV